MSRQSGVAYIGLLLIMALIGIVAGTAADVYLQERQRSREKELLWVGHQYRQAIASYLAASQGSETYPKKLEELLLDPRFPGIRRHLRRLYPDPMTGKADWELIVAPQGGIAGVKSRSSLSPLKQSGFRPRDAQFENKATYSEWEFTLLPGIKKGSAPQGVLGVPPSSAAHSIPMK